MSGRRRGKGRRWMQEKGGWRILMRKPDRLVGDAQEKVTNGQPQQQQQQ
jgi:hypothetical protein